jgi:hypothetical protein
VLGLIFLSDALPHLYRQEFGPRSAVELQKRLDLGDDALVTIARVPVAGGRAQARVVQVMIHDGPVVGLLTIVGLASDLKYADVEPYAAVFAKRIDDGL